MARKLTLAAMRVRRVTLALALWRAVRGHMFPPQADTCAPHAPMPAASQRAVRMPSAPPMAQDVDERALAAERARKRALAEDAFAQFSLQGRTAPLSAAAQHPDVPRPASTQWHEHASDRAQSISFTAGELQAALVNLSTSAPNDQPRLDRLARRYASQMLRDPTEIRSAEVVHACLAEYCAQPAAFAFLYYESLVRAALRGSSRALFEPAEKTHATPLEALATCAAPLEPALRLLAECTQGDRVALMSPHASALMARLVDGGKREEAALLAQTAGVQAVSPLMLIDMLYEGVHRAHDCLRLAHARALEDAYAFLLHDATHAAVPWHDAARWCAGARRRPFSVRRAVRLRRDVLDVFVPLEPAVLGQRAGVPRLLDLLLRRGDLGDAKSMRVLRRLLDLGCGPTYCASDAAIMAALGEGLDRSLPAMRAALARPLVLHPARPTDAHAGTAALHAAAGVGAPCAGSVLAAHMLWGALPPAWDEPGPSAAQPMHRYVRGALRALKYARADRLADEAGVFDVVHASGLRAVDEWGDVDVLRGAVPCACLHAEYAGGRFTHLRPLVNAIRFLNVECIDRFVASAYWRRHGAAALRRVSRVVAGTTRYVFFPGADAHSDRGRAAADLARRRDDVVRAMTRHLADVGRAQ